jgi:DNA-binding response OmpR family regulator
LESPASFADGRLRKIPFLAVIPVIVVSARDGLGNQKRAFEAGAKAFLEKPVNNDELRAVIRQSLNEIAGINQPASGSQGLA